MRYIKLILLLGILNVWVVWGQGADPTDVTFQPLPDLTANPEPLPSGRRDALLGHDGWPVNLYIRDQALCQLREGNPHFITSADGLSNVVLSSDGAFVAFTRSWPSDDEFAPPYQELYSIDLATGTERLLFNTTLLDYSGMDRPRQFDDLQWIPGTHTVSFSSAWGGIGYRRADDLYFLNVEDSTYVPVLAVETGGEVTYSPDGSWAAVSGPEYVHLLRTDLAEWQPEVLIFEPPITYSEFRYYPQIAWSDDSSGIYAVVPPVDPLAPGSTIEVPFIGLNTDTRIAFELFNVVASASLFDDQVSPDGAYLAYTTYVNEGPETELYLVDQSGERTLVTWGEALIFVEWVSSEDFIFSYRKAVGEPLVDVAGHISGELREIGPRQSFSSNAPIERLPPSCAPGITSDDTIASRDISACPNAPAPQLTVGGIGRVLPPSSNNLRGEPALSGTRIGAMAVGETFTILSGPVCNEEDGYLWWQVEYQEQTGWTVEGEGSSYWIEPA